MAYSFARAVTIDHTQCGGSDSANFKFVFDPFKNTGSNLSELKTVGNGGDVTSSNAYDVGWFADIGLATKLDWEVEAGSYDPTTGHIIMWVRIPTLSHTVDTVIYLAYGDSSITTFQGNVAGVYNASFRANWHFTDGSTLSGADSTGNALNLTNNGATATGGQIDGAMTGNYLEQASTTALQFERTDPFTVSCWFDYTVNVQEALISNSASGSFQGWLFAHRNQAGTTTLMFGLENSFATNGIFVWPNTTFTSGTFHHVAVTYDGSSSASGVIFYVDGVPIGSNTVFQDNLSATTKNALTTLVGVFHDGTSGLGTGRVDELAVQDGVQTADWILQSYNNQQASSTFYSIGSVITPTVLDLSRTRGIDFAFSGIASESFSLSRTRGISLAGSVSGVTGAFSLSRTRGIDVDAGVTPPPPGGSSLLFLDTATHYAVGTLPANPASAKWTRADSINYALSGRPGAVAGEQCLTLASGSILYRFVQPQTSMCFGAAIQLSSLPGGAGLWFNSDSASYRLSVNSSGFFVVQRFVGDPPSTNVSITVYLNGIPTLSGTIVPGGAGATIGPSTINAMTAGAWWYIELKATIGGGSAETFHSFQVNPPGGGAGMDATAFYVTDGTQLGNPLHPGIFTPARLRTNGDGAVTDGVPSTPGPHWLMTTEQPPTDPAPDNTNTYVDLGLAGQEELHEIEDIIGNPSIVALQGVWHCGKNHSGQAAYQAILRNMAGTEYICPIYPGSGEFDRYPSYSPDGWDFSHMETAPFLLSPFTGLAWTVAEVNGLQMGVKKIAAEGAGGGTTTFTADFEGAPNAGWTSSFFSTTTDGRHLKGGADGGHLNYVLIVGSGMSGRVSMGAAQRWNGSNPLGIGLANTDIATMNSSFSISGGGVIQLLQSAFGQAAVLSPFIDRFASDEHWYFVEIMSEVTGFSVVDHGGGFYTVTLSMQSWIRLNGRTQWVQATTWSTGVSSPTPPTAPSFDLAYVVSPGGGQQSVTDDVYVAFDAFVGDSDAGTPAPNPAIRITQMTLEVVQGPPVMPIVSFMLKCPKSTIVVGQPYDDFFIITGSPVGAVTFAILTGGLATGLSLNASTGEITGTPSGAGPFAYTAQATDSMGNLSNIVSCSMRVCTSASSLV